MPRGIKATAPAEPTTQAETPVMPEQFDENAAEAEAVALADHAEEPKRKRKSQEPIPDPVVLMIAAQRLQSRGIAIGFVPHIMSLADESGEFQVVHGWDSGEIVVEDTAYNTRRSQINSSRQHAEVQWYSHKVMYDNAVTQEKGLREALELRLSSDKAMGILTPPNFIQAAENNIAAMQREQERIRPMVAHWKDKLNEATAGIENLPARRRWKCALEGPLEIEFYTVAGNEQH